MKQLLRGTDVALATEGHLVVMSLNYVNVATLDATTDATAAHRAEYKSRGRVLSIARTSMKLPDAATRDRLNELYFQENSPGKIVTVLEATGFWAAAVRGILATATLMTKNASHIVPNIEEALLYLDFTAAEIPALAASIRTFRDDHYALVEQEKARERAEKVR